MKQLKGYKTYIVAALLAAVTFATAAGWIDEPTAKLALAFLAACGLATMRDAVKP